MKIDELKTGMVVLDRTGNYYRVMKDTPHGDLLVGKNGWNQLDRGYTDELKNSDFSEFDIILVMTVKPHTLTDKYFNDFSEDVTIVYERVEQDENK